MNKADTLVSIVVITYNSSKFVEECLESIKAQTYKNIELIISDDCSSDKTISICKKWLEKNKNRFVNVELIEVSENTGVTKNINRGCMIAKGEWIKPLAGDDILLPKCIELNIQHCDGKNLVFSQVELFSEYKNLGLGYSNETKKYFSLTAKEQFNILFENNFIFAPSSFINKSYLLNIGCFDEKYPMVEDYPLWIKSTYHGEKLHYFDALTVKYRIHDKSLSNIAGLSVNVKMHKFNKLFFKEFIKLNKCIGFCTILNKLYRLFIHEYIIKNGNNHVAYLKSRKFKYLNLCKYWKKIKLIKGKIFG